MPPSRRQIQGVEKPQQHRYEARRRQAVGGAAVAEGRQAAQAVQSPVRFGGRARISAFVRQTSNRTHTPEEDLYAPHTERRPLEKGRRCETVNCFR